jgi:hypothetical protein
MDGSRDAWAAVIAGPRVGEHLTSHHGQPERALEFAIREQTGIGRDDGSTKLKHQSAVEIESENIDRKSMASRSILPLPDWPLGALPRYGL